MSYEIDKSIEHGNTIIPILIDNDDSLSKDDELKMDFDKLPKKFCKRLDGGIKNAEGIILLIG